jgi:hypothetical protein
MDLGAGVAPLREEECDNMDGAGVWLLASGEGVASVVGLADEVMEMERECKALNRAEERGGEVGEMGEVARGDAGVVGSEREDAEVVETVVVGGSVAPREEAKDRSWLTSARSCWHSWLFCSYIFRWKKRNVRRLHKAVFYI